MNYLRFRKDSDKIKKLEKYLTNIYVCHSFWVKQHHSPVSKTQTKHFWLFIRSIEIFHILQTISRIVIFQISVNLAAFLQHFYILI